MDPVVALLEGPFRIEAPRTDDAVVQRLCAFGKARHLGEVLLAFSALHRNMRPVCKAEATPLPRWLMTDAGSENLIVGSDTDLAAIAERVVAQVEIHFSKRPSVPGSL